MKGGPESYTDILDLIQSDFRAQDILDKMRDLVTTFTTTRRAKTVNDDEKSSSTMRITTKKGARYASPNNTGTLLPTFIYTQICDWFYHMMKPEKDRMDD